jgi:hypothetical protein
MFTEMELAELVRDYRYSTKLVYNNYPWPENVTEERREAVERAAKAVLTARDGFPQESLADLYDPIAMPANLFKAHRDLDQAVDRCYRSAAFESERQRLEFLFGLYAKYTTPLIGKAKRKSARG